MKDKIIRPRKPKGVSKSPWEYRTRKMAKRAQGKYTESLREELATSPKRPTKFGSNNATVRMAKQYGGTHKDCKKGQEMGLKEEKPMAKQRPSPKKEQALKNEMSKNGSRHNKSRMGGRMYRQAFRPRRTHEWQADFRYT